MINKEKVEPKIFHIHFDGDWMAKTLQDQLTDDFGFVLSNFSGSTEGHSDFIPKVHLTYKTFEKNEYHKVWKSIEKLVDNDNFKGYIEGEYLPSDEIITYKDFKDKEPNFYVEKINLSDLVNKEFRQTELHISMNLEKSNPLLIERLLSIGLFGGEINKDRGNFIVLTAQGFIRDIKKLYKLVIDYINEVGGAVDCTMKEERIVNYKLVAAQVKDLPPIVSNIIIK